jgi:hypothetical protein
VLGGLLLVLLGFAAPTARAADTPGLSAAVKAGFDGNYRNGEWFGAQVTLSNDSDDDRSGTLGLTGQGNLRAASLDIALPGHSRKQVWLYAFNGQYYSGSIQLVLRRGDTIFLQRDISLSFNDNSSFIIAVVGGDGGALSSLSGMTLGNVVTTTQGSGSLRTTVAHIGLDELPPAPAALDGLDALVVVDGDTSQLSATQRAAVRAWVIGGGDLVIAGGQVGAGNAAGFADILPVRVTAPQPLADLSPLAKFAGSSEPITLTGQVVASGATLQPAARLLAASADGSPLLAQRDYGRGRVSYIAVDPNLGALRAWGGYASLWQSLFATHYGGPTFNALNMDRFGFGASLLPQLDLPDPTLLLIVLLVYIVVVGPLNYLLLRQLGRREFAWLTTPLITLLFAVVFYAIGYQSKGGDVLVSRSTVVFASGQDDTAIIAGTIGIFSPSRTSYSLSLSDTALAGDVGYSSNIALGGASNVTPSTLRLGTPNTLTDIAIPNWQQREVAVQDRIKLPPQFSAQARRDGPTVKLTVKNLASQPYTDVVLYAPSEQQVSASFSLAVGESKEVALAKKYSDANQLVSDLSGGNGGSVYYYGGRGGGVVYFPNGRRGQVSEAERQQEARDQLAGLMIGSREVGLGLSTDVTQGPSSSNSSLPPSKDKQIYIAAWSDHNYLPASLAVSAQEQQSVTLYVAPVASEP